MIPSLGSYHKNIFFYAHHTFENWDFKNPIFQGIGGSETSQIEMASRLAQRHHNVVSYAPVPWYPKANTIMHRNVTWKHFSTATFEEPGFWIIYRYPEALDNFKPSSERINQEVWFVAQDVFYSTLTEERAAKIDKYICLCSDHANYMIHRHPYLASKIVVSSNGINVDLINDIKKQDFTKNPHRLIYSSSPDRGLQQLIPIFKRAKEYISDLELHVFYGFDNIDKVIVDMPWVGEMKDSIMSGINSTDGIFWHGRVGQVELLCEWMKSGIWVYPINFTETSCISCMEAQATNTIPIVSPIWALRENVMHGVFVDGDAKDKLTLSRFVGEIVRVCNSEELRKKLTEKMSIEAKFRFNWERYVDQWESWIYAAQSPFFFTQYAFQQKYAYGSILNIGSDSDASGFKEVRNAINLDIVPNTNATTDILLDIRAEHETREMAKLYPDGFDTIILGDILEHMCYDEGMKVLQNMQIFSHDDTRFIITCPSDPRPRHVQRCDNPTLPDDAEYPGGVSMYHRYVEYEDLINMILTAGLDIHLMQDLDYTHFHGWGIVCEKTRV